MPGGLPTGGLKVTRRVPDPGVIDHTHILSCNIDYCNISGLLRMPGSSAAITIGATPPTSSSAGTGIWIDRTGIYGLASNTKQFYMDATTGKGYFGGGEVVLDADGQLLALVSTSDYNPTSIRWRTGTSPNFVNGTRLQSYITESNRVNSEMTVPANTGYDSYSSVRSFGAAGKTASAMLIAVGASGATGQVAGVGIDNSSGYVLLHAADSGGSTYQYLYSTHAKIGTDLRVTGGLHVGSDTDPADDCIVADGTITGTQLISNIAIGTAPLVVTSTTKVTNLDADTVDGQHAATLGGGIDFLTAQVFS